MKTVQQIIAIIYFIIKELPAFLKDFRRSQQDKAHENLQEKLSSAMVAYKENPSAKALKEIEKEQTR